LNVKRFSDPCVKRPQLYFERSKRTHKPQSEKSSIEKIFVVDDQQFKMIKHRLHRLPYFTGLSIEGQGKGMAAVTAD
jgi:hypothetical protein